MKRFISLIVTLFTLTSLSAQEKEFLAPFTALDIDAHVQLKLVKIQEHEAPYIIYDTKGAENTKFIFNIKNKTLKVRERHDSKRQSITEVTIGFTSLTDISIAKADTKVEGILTSQLLDLYISNDANLIAEVDVLDIMSHVSGKSRVELYGYTRYHTAEVSSARYNAHELHSVSTIVESSHNAIARVSADERLEAKTNTGGKVYYRIQPTLLRSRITAFGGEITRIK